MDELHYNEWVQNSRPILQKSDSHVGISFAQNPYYCHGKLRRTQSTYAKSEINNCANMKISNTCAVEIDVHGDPNISLPPTTLQEGSAPINMGMDTESLYLNMSPEHCLADVCPGISATDHANYPPPSYADATHADLLPSYNSVFGPCVCKRQINVFGCQSKSKCGRMYGICRYIIAAVLFVLVFCALSFYYLIKNCHFPNVC